jgi:hypothetical protein
MPEETTEATESSQEQAEQSAETTETTEQSEATDSPETTEQEQEQGAETQPEPTTVPITRFNEVYGKGKQAEREAAQARREADYWRNEAQRQGQTPESTAIQPQGQPIGEPQSEQFDDYNDYVKALTRWNLDQDKAKSRAEEEQRQAQQRNAQFQKKLNEGAAKHEDFIDTVYNDSLPITTAMVDALAECEHAADIAYHLGKNPQEAGRIAALTPIGAAREIGKLEMQFSTPAPAQRSKTKAGASTSPVGSGEAPPKKLEDMSTAEFIAYRNKQEFGT